MRWPLRRQILLPMAGILLLTIALLSASSAWLASAQVHRQLDQRLAAVANTLAQSNFPLRASVLAQVRDLTGADYVVLDADRRAFAASDAALTAAAEKSPSAPPQLDLSQIETVAHRNYFHIALPVDRRPLGSQRWMLHVFYPVAAWREARWQAIWPSIAIGSASLVIVTLAVSLVARRIAAPLRDLRRQADQIAQGNFHPLPVPSRADEVQDLAVAVNQMAERLAQYEAEIRHSERLKTLGTLGAGIAHQIRNAATGCRMALDLHRRDCPLAAANGHAPPPLEVAARQLTQIENYVHRFLALGAAPKTPHAPADLAEIVRTAFDLTRPTAQHRGIQLLAELSPEPAVISGDSHALTQMLVNLLMNAIEAAAQGPAAAAAVLAPSPRIVTAKLIRSPGNLFELSVSDTGPGPRPAIVPRLFEPFATDKPGGTGLGLAVSQQIADDHGGSIRWERAGGRTVFHVSLPSQPARVT